MSRDSKCFVCDRDSELVPLIAIEFRGSSLHICPQHLPVLIHDPTALADRLPGAEGLRPADHHD